MKSVNDAILIKSLDICNQLKNELIALGFNVKEDAELGGMTHVDLYAEKGDDKRIYEIKIGEKNLIPQELFDKLQSKAKELGAKLYIVNAKLPKSSTATFEGIEDIICEDMINDFPSDLDILSHTTRIESVDNVVIEEQNIRKQGFHLEGYGYVNVSLQFVGDRDKDVDDFTERQSFYFDFILELDRENNVIKSEYNFDLGNYLSDEEFYGEDIFDTMFPNGRDDDD